MDGFRVVVVVDVVVAAVVVVIVVVVVFSPYRRWHSLVKLKSGTASLSSYHIRRKPVTFFRLKPRVNR